MMFTHVQRRSGLASHAKPDARISASPGRPLDTPLRSLMESRFGHDFGRVRVFADDGAGELTRTYSAHAFAAGDSLVFAPGAYRPDSRAGRALIAHELTHVVQQARTPGAARGAPPSPAARSSAEREAEQLAAVVGGSDATAQRVHVAAASTAHVQCAADAPVLPVAKFSPAPGLFVDRTEQATQITGAMELSGPEATPARAASIEASINTTWTQTFPDGYSIRCNIRVTYRAPGSKAGNATQISAAKLRRPSHISPGFGGRSMTLNANESDAFSWTPAHEFGHILGLADRYSESIISKIKGQFGGERSTPAQPGYEKNLMGVSGGELESKNIRDLARENEPSAYWINDDDQVRDWVNGHSLDDIGRLPVASKLRAIATLMGGWISDADVAAIARICASVSTRTEADALRGGINIGRMTSVGQRTMVRAALAKMP